MKCQSTGSMLHVAVAIAAALTATACATRPTRSAAEQARDAELAARVELALSRDPRIYARHIDVSVEQGIVRLTGYVWSTEDLYEAKRVAATVPGVAAVMSQLVMMVGGRSGSR